MLSRIKKELSNLPGWRTKRHIVVIESDDWGSIRLSSKTSFEKLKQAGIPVDKSHYNSHDALESNSDLEMLMEVLSRYKDATGRSAVFTGVNITANPDFEKIRKNGFTQYEYEPFIKTYQRYPKHNKVYGLWKEAKERRLIVPQFHGREHLNVQRWMKALRSGCPSTRLAFEHGITGISHGINGEKLPDYQAAFDIDDTQDAAYQKEVIETGLNLFEELFGYRAHFFIPTNGPFNNSLEPVAKHAGIKYLATAKIQVEPLGNSQYKKHFRYLGEKGISGLTYITRNAFF